MVRAAQERLALKARNLGARSQGAVELLCLRLEPEVALVVCRDVPLRLQPAHACAVVSGGLKQLLSAQQLLELGI